ncbi:site-specific integrase [Roseicella sp. DB1501]|uniref:site-specific integrase n=1 Tax=Roseicella sp. DB1501 TaxID=2730925 RepID=UPI0014913DB4|nr:site-specific integrase [Roseicella sp. DB1501]NOG71963.1 site-specific integrase [Roseicella sp. DB1501]
MTGHSASNVVDLSFKPGWELKFAPAGATIDGLAAEGLPLLYEPSGRLHTQTTQYFVQIMIRDGTARGTCRVIAYVLKDWFRFLDGEKIPWDQPSDELLASWAKAQGPSGEERGKAREQRINDKLHFVFEYYRKLQAMHLIRAVVEDPRASEMDDVGRPKVFPMRSVVEVRLGRGHVRRETLRSVVRYSDPKEERGGKRYTPDSGEVEKVFDELLSGADPFTRTRAFFCARSMAHMGLRRQGAAAISTTMLEEALRAKGIEVPDFETPAQTERGALIAAGWKPWLRGLDAIADMPGERAEIIGRLEQLEREYHKFIYVRVVEKGHDARYVPMPLRLVRAILVEWVWGHRRDFITERRSRHPSYLPPDKLWLSRRSGAAMSEGAIGNEIKRAFKALEIDASGHRLRAYFLTELLAELYYRARSIHGAMFDQQAILMEAAEIAGQNDPRSLEPYLDRVRLADNHAFGEPVFVRSPEDAAVMRALSDRLSSGEEDARVLRRMLTLLLEKFSLRPVPLVPTLSDPQHAIRRHKACQDGQ